MSAKAVRFAMFTVSYKKTKPRIQINNTRFSDGNKSPLFTRITGSSGLIDQEQADEMGLSPPRMCRYIVEIANFLSVTTREHHLKEKQRLLLLRYPTGSSPLGVKRLS